MLLLVSDTSVLVDLDRGGLLEAAFTCGLTMVVPDLLYEKELKDENGPYLQKLGLGVTSLTPAELSFAQKLKANRPVLSLPDCFALCCAKREGHALLSGDKALRNEAKKHSDHVYGLLWLLDAMAATGKVERAQLFAGLQAIAMHPRSRLPAEEVRSRLTAWGAAE